MSDSGTISDSSVIPVPKIRSSVGENPRAASCALCGLPVPSREAAQAAEDKLKFCCPGCRQVHTVLSVATGTLPVDFQKSDLYQACLQSGVIPSPDRTVTGKTVAPEQSESVPPLEMTFRVDNMWCPACGWLVEEILKRKRGVLGPQVSFLTDTARLTYMPHVVTPDEIKSAVRRLGYGVSSVEDKSGRVKQERNLLLRLGISAILSMNAMMLSWAIYSGLFRDLGSTVITFLSYPLLLITLPVIFYGGMPILRNAWTGVTVRRVSMDTLIAIGVLAAFSYSLAEMAEGGIHLYFDTAAMLITIVLFGRFVEMKARHRVLAGVDLDELGTLKARLLHDGRERWVSTDAVRPGDVILVRTNERVPLDGRVKKGSGFLDQSVLTGEAGPVARVRPEEVLAGSMLVDGEIEVTTTRIAGESYLRRMVELTVKALEGKETSGDFADTFSRAFVPALLAATLLTGVALLLLGVPGRESLFRCLTMLVISCPCAIGIATPLARMAIMGSARKRGIVVKNVRALDWIPSIDTIVFDKTGTVTEGRFAYNRMVSTETDEEEALPLLAALEEISNHVVGREIIRRARFLGFRIADASDAKEAAGRGVTGRVGGLNVFLGNRSLIAELSLPLPSPLDADARKEEQAGMTTIFFGWDGTVRGFVVFGDPLRADATELMDWLRGRNLRPILLSGDGLGTTAAVARSLGIDDFSGEMLPSGKAERVAQLMGEGHRVAVIGDGINDVAALAQASVGIAFGTGYSLMENAADLALVSGRIGTTKDIFALGAISGRTVRQNLAFAFIYNVIAIPVAAAGLLNPLIAVAAMFASSLTVIGNALRIVRNRSNPV